MLAQYPRPASTTESSPRFDLSLACHTDDLGGYPRLYWQESCKKEGNEISGSVWGMLIFGFIVGIATGVAGLGGYALVPGLLYFFSAPVYITMGTSLAVMIPLALVGGLIKLSQGFVSLIAGGLLGGSTIVGAQVGAAVIKRFKPYTLKFIFGIYFLYVALKFVFGYFGINIW